MSSKNRSPRPSRTRPGALPEKRTPLDVSTTTLAVDPPRRFAGRIAPVAVVLATKTLTLGLVLAGYYVLAFFAAIRVVPTVMGFVKAGSGVTMDMATETIIAVWLAPSLFLIALLFALVLLAMKALWALRSRAVRAVSLWALGAADSSPVATSVKTARTRQNETKAA